MSPQWQIPSCLVSAFGRTDRVKAMKILIVSQYFWPEAFRINDIGRGLVGRGHDVTVLTGMPNYPKGRLYAGYGVVGPDRENYEGVKIVRVPLCPRGKNSKWQLVVNYVSFFVFASCLGPFRLCRDYDVIFVYAPSPITVALPGFVMGHLCKAPVLLWVQDLWPESLTAVGAVKSRLVLRLVARLVGWTYRRCSLLVVQSKGFIKEVQSYGIEPERICHLPNPAEELYRKMSLDSAARERKEVPDGFCVMFAGNIGVAQSFDTILDAAERTYSYRDIHWVIIGDGVSRERVERQIRQRSLEATVHLLGWKPVEAMARYLSLAEVLLVTLKRQPIFALTVPAKLQSYLACGKPIVSCLDGEGARLVRESESGVAVPAEDSHGLAEAVVWLRSKSPEYRSELGRNGIRYCETHFSMKKVLDSLERILATAVSGQS